LGRALLLKGAGSLWFDGAARDPLVATDVGAGHERAALDRGRVVVIWNREKPSGVDSLSSPFPARKQTVISFWRGLLTQMRYGSKEAASRLDITTWNWKRRTSSRLLHGVWHLSLGTRYSLVFNIIHHTHYPTSHLPPPTTRHTHNLSPSHQPFLPLTSNLFLSPTISLSHQQYLSLTSNLSLSFASNLPLSPAISLSPPTQPPNPTSPPRHSPYLSTYSPTHQPTNPSTH